MACFCFSWPCMHTKTSDIDNVITGMRSRRACTEIVDENTLKQERAKLMRERRARIADQNPYHDAPWTRRLCNQIGCCGEETCGACNAIRARVKP